MKNPMTQIELANETERVAYARCVCKGVKFPNERAVEDEKNAILAAMNREAGTRPTLSVADASAWLKSNGYVVPPPPAKQ